MYEFLDSLFEILPLDMVFSKSVTDNLFNILKLKPKLPVSEEFLRVLFESPNEFAELMEGLKLLLKSSATADNEKFYNPYAGSYEKTSFNQFSSTLSLLVENFKEGIIKGLEYYPEPVKTLKNILLDIQEFASEIFKVRPNLKQDFAAAVANSIVELNNSKIDKDLLKIVQKIFQNITNELPQNELKYLLNTFVTFLLPQTIDPFFQTSLDIKMRVIKSMQQLVNKLMELVEIDEGKLLLKREDRACFLKHNYSEGNDDENYNFAESKEKLANRFSLLRSLNFTDSSNSALIFSFPFLTKEGAASVLGELALNRNEEEYSEKEDSGHSKPTIRFELNLSRLGYVQGFIFLQTKEAVFYFASSESWHYFESKESTLISKLPSGWTIRGALKPFDKDRIKRL
jgi:hypothetical protein